MLHYSLDSTGKREPECISPILLCCNSPGRYLNHSHGFKHQYFAHLPPHFGPLTSPLSHPAGWLSEPRLAGLHRLHPHVRRRRTLAEAAAQAVVSAHIGVHLAGEDSRFGQFEPRTHWSPNPALSGCSSTRISPYTRNRALTRCGYHFVVESKCLVRITGSYVVHSRYPIVHCDKQCSLTKQYLPSFFAVAQEKQIINNDNNDIIVQPLTNVLYLSVSVYQ